MGSPIIVKNRPTSQFDFFVRWQHALQGAELGIVQSGYDGAFACPAGEGLS
jgi:hypothetical protein